MTAPRFFPPDLPAFLIAKVLLIVAAPVPAQDLLWPEFRGPGRDGVAAADASLPLTWSATENLAWKLELPGGGSSSPIVVGERVYVACYSGYGNILPDGGEPEDLRHHVVCVDRASGRMIWDRAIPGPLDLPVPRVQITEHGFASPTPTSDGESIFAYFGRAGVLALDLDGEIRWQAELGTPAIGAAPTNTVNGPNGQPIPLRWGTAASPLLYENLLIVNSSEQNNSIAALDKSTGDVVWRRESPNLEGSAISPILAGRTGERVLVIALGGEVWGLEPESGQQLWQVETGTRGGMVPTPVADDELVYAFGGSGQGHALRFQRTVDGSGRVVWQSSNLDIPSPVLHDGLLFLVRTNGTASCLAAEDGESLLNGRLPGRTGGLYASPVVGDDRLYVVSRERGTFVYSADAELRLLARNELDDDSQFNASPAITGDQMFLRSDRFLYCISGT